MIKTLLIWLRKPDDLNQVLNEGRPLEIIRKLELGIYK